MVAKINVGNNLYGTLTYNDQKVEDGHAQVLCVNEMWESRNGKYLISDFTQAFNLRLDKNQRTENPIVHISLNPSPHDVLTNEQLQKIAREYMEKMGFGKRH